MGGEQVGGDRVSDESRGYDRRLVLKAAVATGVGAAAWAGPQIGRLGSAPAYASHCTEPVVSATFDGGSINNGSGCGAAAEANFDINGTSNGITVVSTGRCLNDIDGANVTFSGGGFCKLTVIVLKNNGTNACRDGAEPGSSAIFPSGSLIPYPTVGDGDCPAGNVFIKAECSVNSHCL